MPKDMWMRASCELSRFRRGIVDTSTFVLDLIIYIFCYIGNGNYNSFLASPSLLIRNDSNAFNRSVSVG